MAVIDEPRLLEVVRSDQACPWPGCSRPSSPAPSPRPRPARRATAAATRASARSSTSRPPAVRGRRTVRSCAVVSDRPELAAALTAALEARSIACHRLEPADGFGAAAGACAPPSCRRTGRRPRRRPAAGAAPAGTAGGLGAGRWPSTAASLERPPHRRRVGPGGRRLRGGRRAAGAPGDPHRRHHLGRSQPGPGRGAAARVGGGHDRGRVTAFAASLEGSGRDSLEPAAELVAHLLSHPDAGALAGAELAVGRRLVRAAQPPATRSAASPTAAPPSRLAGRRPARVVGAGDPPRPREPMTDGPPGSSTPTCTSGTRPGPTGTRTCAAPAAAAR